MSGAYDALNIEPGFDKDMTLLAYFKKSNPSKAVWQPTNVWQKSWREQVTQRPSRPQNQPNEERMKSTLPRKRQ